MDLSFFFACRAKRAAKCSSRLKLHKALVNFRKRQNLLLSVNALEKLRWTYKCEIECFRNEQKLKLVHVGILFTRKNYLFSTIFENVQNWKKRLKILDFKIRQKWRVFRFWILNYVIPNRFVLVWRLSGIKLTICVDDIG